MIAGLQTFTNVKLLDQNLSRVEETFKATKSTMSRVSVIAIAMEEIPKRPFTGLEYKEMYEIVSRSKYSVRDFNIAHPHNFALVSIMNNGIVGSVFLILIIIKSLSTAKRLVKTDQFRLAGTFLFCSIVYFLIFSLMNTTMTTVGYVFWFLCGSIYWFSNKALVKR